ncbi:tRNA pseudouridine(38-40) synthase TruA [soil metagenome]
MRRVKFVISYDGRNYRGSQIQPGVPTVQDTFEHALRQVRAYAGRTTFAGRTDAGVHALGQVVSADVEWERELERLSHGLNSVLPRDVRVLECEFVEPGFNARFDVVAREYRYRIVTDHLVTPLMSSSVWACKCEIDSGLAAAASRSFVGTHRFGSFASAGLSQSACPGGLERTVYECDWIQLNDRWFPVRNRSEVYELRVRANGFLPQMVRNIVRAVVEVGSGNQPLEWIEFLLVSGDRRLLGSPAPPHGLVLWRVDYEAGPDPNTDCMN